MDRKDRKTLKSYFQKGDVPTEGQFAELIDSVPNIEEDGQVERTDKGWAFRPKSDGSLSLTLHTTKGEPATWTIHAAGDGNLYIRNRQGEVVMELAQDKTVTLHGKLVTDGTPKPGPQPHGYVEAQADKSWTDIAEVTHGGEGNRVYTVIAMFRDDDLGVCKLTRATAICLDSISQWIESPKRHWWGWSGRVKLRWLNQDGKSLLQVRSRRNHPSGIICCRVMETFRK